MNFQERCGNTISRAAKNRAVPCLSPADLRLSLGSENRAALRQVAHLGRRVEGCIAHDERERGLCLPQATRLSKYRQIWQKRRDCESRFAIFSSSEGDPDGGRGLLHGLGDAAGSDGELRRRLLDRACSRLYRGQILQENMRLKVLAEVYTMHSLCTAL